MVRRRFQPGRFVRFGDGVQSPLNAARLEVPGTRRNIDRYGFRQRGQGAQTVPRAPRAKVPPVALVAP